MLIFIPGLLEGFEKFWKVLKRKKYFLLLQALESTYVGRIRIGVDKILESVPDFGICTILILIRITNCSGTDIALVRTKSGTLYVIPKSFWNPWLVPEIANKTRFDEMVLVHWVLICNTWSEASCDLLHTYHSCGDTAVRGGGEGLRHSAAAHAMDWSCLLPIRYIIP